MFTRIKRLLLGEPLTSHADSHQQRIPKWQALPTLASDALSSTAYATESILVVLAVAGAAAMEWSIPIAMGIVLLLIILMFSYRQTIEAYPTGGGAYSVAKENLGTIPSLVAGAALLIEYVLTVAVSISAGVENLASAFPELQAHRVGAGAVIIAIIMFLNLRGIRESATIFAFPTYFFIFSMFSVIIVGLIKTATGAIPPAAPMLPAAYPAVPMILLMRAYASGCAALTGVEAISNGVNVFRPPTARNAKITLMWMAVILGSLFLGITILAHVLGLAPRESETLISTLARSVYGDSFLYYMVQFATALILFLAANTAYTGFPSVASLLAKDRFLPRQLTSVGDRLVFSNGIMGLSVGAMLLIVLFEGDTLHLIPLYAVGVFLSFTISQVGMIQHHRMERQRGWIRSLSINALGAATTLLVLLDIAFTKFMAGAWMVVIAIPFLVLVFLRINRHYLIVGKELSVFGEKPPAKLEKVKHTVIIPISGIHRGVIEALRYSLSISDDVRACYVEIDPAVTEKVKEDWERWVPGVPFVVLKSPYRSVVQPLIKYIDDVEEISHDDVVTVVVPEFVTSKWWHSLLHNQTALFIRAALAFKKGKVVTSVRYHLRGT